MKHLTLAVVFLFSLCFPIFAQKEKTLITPNQAIEIAQQEALNRNIRPIEWFGGRITANFDDYDNSNQWLIMFHGRPNENGREFIHDNFLVILSLKGELVNIFQH